MDNNIYAYYKKNSIASSVAQTIRDNGYTAEVRSVDDDYEIPYRFGGSRSFMTGLIAGAVIGALTGWLIYNLTIATLLTWPVMSAGWPAIMFLFMALFASIGGFAGWFTARPWQAQYIVAVKTQAAHVGKINDIMTKQHPVSVSQQVISHE